MGDILFNLSDIHYLLFIIPGFVLIWSYRFFAKAKPIGEFEYAALSFIWGFILVGSTGFIVRYFPKYDNLYYFTVYFSIFGVVFGRIGSLIAKWKWFVKLMDKIKPKNFKK